MRHLRNIIFGLNLDEGLIKTYPSDKTCKILNNDSEFKSLFRAEAKNAYSLKVSFGKKSLVDDDPTLNEMIFLENYFGVKSSDSLTYLLKKLNTMGYYPNFYTVMDGTRINSERFSYNNICDFIDNKSSDSAIFVVHFMAKYSEVKTDNIPNKIYHISKTKFRDKIKKIGLTPKGNERYDERIYVVFDKNNISDKFVKNMKNHSGENQYDVYEIITTGLNLKFYKDPEFTDKGYYIKANIPPKNIKLIETI
jgi:hypothetical protein